MLVHGKTCLALGSSRSFLYVSVPLPCHLTPPVPPTDLWPPLKNNLLMTSRQTTLLSSLERGSRQSNLATKLRSCAWNLHLRAGVSSVQISVISCFKCIVGVAMRVKWWEHQVGQVTDRCCSSSRYPLFPAEKRSSQPPDQLHGWGKVNLVKTGPFTVKVLLAIYLDIQISL
jgi:hypothetical protein